MKKILNVAIFLLISSAIYSISTFLDNGNGTITANRTGLLWTKCSLTSMGAIDVSQDCSGIGRRSWQQALEDCSNLDHGGRSDWRLPNINELRTLIDVRYYSPAIDSYYFPNTGTGSYYYWSSTTDIYDLSRAWYVGFNEGSSNSRQKTYTYYVRCVAGP